MKITGGERGIAAGERTLQRSMVFKAHGQRAKGIQDAAERAVASTQAERNLQRSMAFKANEQLGQEAQGIQVAAERAVADTSRGIRAVSVPRV